MRKFHEAIASFPQRTVVVVGDVVADQFLSGTISRVSREAPVFIMRHDETVTLPGGAANAAANIVALGARPVLIGLVGEDVNGELLAAALDTSGVGRDFLVSSSALTTTTKVRVLAGQHYAPRQQVIRIDYEDRRTIDAGLLQWMRTEFAAQVEAADAIIISDYGCGAVFPEIFKDALEAATRKSIPLIVDSRSRLTEFAGATTATPNREEVESILGPEFTPAECEELRVRLGLTALLVTYGNEGMTLFEKGRPAHHIDAVGSTEPVDVTGAGDTVIAAYALGLASGLSFAESATIANHAGGIVVMRRRTATVSTKELLASLNGEPEPQATTHAG